MIAISIPNGILHIAESLAKCPHCSNAVPIEAVDEKLYNSKSGHIRHKCKGCKRFMGVMSDYKGDVVAYKLNEKSI